MQARQNRAAFISYSSRNEEWVQVLHQNLELCLSSEIFLDRLEIPSGCSVVTEVQRGLHNARQLILVVTPEAMASRWVQNESNTFLASGKQGLHLVKLVDAPLPPFLAETSWLDFEGHDEAAYRTKLQVLVGALLGYSDRRDLPALPPGIRVPQLPTVELASELRMRIVKLLAKPLEAEVFIDSAESRFGLDRGTLQGYASAACVASAALVRLMDRDDPVAGLLRGLKQFLPVLKKPYPGVFSELTEIVGTLEGQTPPESPIDLYLKHLPSEHQNLVPILDDEDGLDLLDKVYVEVELRAEDRSRRVEPAEGGSEEGPPGKLFDRTLEIGDLLDLSPDEHPWVTNRWVLRGHPGTGKSTMLRYLASRLAQVPSEERQWIPVFVSLPRILAEPGWFLEAMEDRLVQAGHAVRGLAIDLEREGKDGRLLVLLDGLDEVPKLRRPDAEEMLRSLARRWEKTPLVVTTRPIPYAPFDRRFREADLQPLNEERAQKLLAKWFARKDDSAVGEAHRARAAVEYRSLASDQNLVELMGNPLYLTFIALLLVQGKKPARNRSDLYEQVIANLMEGKHRRKERRIAMERPKAVRRALAYLSYELTKVNEDGDLRSELEDRLYAPEARAEHEELRAVPRWRDSLGTFFEDLSDRTAILGPYDVGRPDWWSFLHRSFRESFAADHLKQHYEGEKRGGLLRRVVEHAAEAREKAREAVLSQAGRVQGDESRWAEPYALLAGRVDQPDELVLTLMKENPALGLRALATAQRLNAETFTSLLELPDLRIEQRGDIVLGIPERLGDAERALRLLNQLRQETRDGNDLFFLYDALPEVERLYPEDAGQAERVRECFFDHIPAPPCELFQWIEPPKDGRVPLWREIPAGENWMGSSEGEGRGGEHPRHRVHVLHPFAMASVPVTNAQYAAFDPSKPPRAWDGVSAEELAGHPRVEVTRYEAVSFCRWLSRHLPGARLPTEAEWEYACRAGTETQYWSGDAEADLARVGWYRENAETRTHQVGEKPANPWGLYDVHGNVWEWTFNPRPSDYSEHASGREVNPREPPAPPRDVDHVVRGGSCWNDDDRARAAYRGFGFPWVRNDDMGFRVVLPAVPEP